MVLSKEDMVPDCPEELKLRTGWGGRWQTMGPKMDSEKVIGEWTSVGLGKEWGFSRVLNIK